MRISISILLLLFFISCSNENNSGAPVADTKSSAIPIQQAQSFDINSMRPVLSALQNQACGFRLRGNSDSLEMLYSEKARICPESGSFITGKNAIGDYWKNYDGMMQLNRNAISFEGNEKLICETGIETGSMNGTKNHNRESWNYKYITIWEKQEDGSWKILTEMWNKLD